MAAGTGAAIQGVGMAASTVGSLQTVAEQRKMLKSEALSVEQQAAFDETQTRRQNKLFLGEANAVGAASGVDISSGSPLLHELDRIKQTEMEALNIRRAGENRVNSINFQRKLLKRQRVFEGIKGAAGGGSILSSYARGR